MNQPDYEALQNSTAPLDTLITAMGFPTAKGVTFTEVEARAGMLAQEVMMSFHSGSDRDALIQNLEAICAAVKTSLSLTTPIVTAPTSVAVTASTPPMPLPLRSPQPPMANAVPSTTPVVPRPVSSARPSTTGNKAKNIVLIGLASLVLLPVSCIVLSSITSSSKSSGSQQSDGSTAVDPVAGVKNEEPTRPQSRAEKVKGVADGATGTVMKTVPGIINTAQKSWVEFNIADDANLWIWIHIKEGNYDHSEYDSKKGYTSFKACLNDVNPNIIDGTGLYDYDFAANEAALRKAKFPKVTGNNVDLRSVLAPDGTYKEPVPGPTLIAAVIEGDNSNRVRMIKDLVARGADVNQRFGPDGTTALMLAAQHDDKDVVAYLVQEANAKVNTKDLKGVRAYDFTQSETIRGMLE